MTGELFGHIIRHAGSIRRVARILGSWMVIGSAARDRRDAPVFGALLVVIELVKMTHETDEPKTHEVKPSEPNERAWSAIDGFHPGAAT